MGLRMFVCGAGGFVRLSLVGCVARGVGFRLCRGSRGIWGMMIRTGRFTMVRSIVGVTGTLLAVGGARLGSGDERR